MNARPLPFPRLARMIVAWLVSLLILGGAHAQPVAGVTPSSLHWRSNAWVEVTISNLAAGTILDIQLFTDVAGNSQVDAIDPLVASYRVQDGLTNALGSPLIVDDEDGLANGVMMARIPYFGMEDGAKRLVGHYLWRARLAGSGAVSPPVPFAITQPTSPVWITGKVIDATTSNGIPGAVLELECFADLPTPMIWANTNGEFTYYLPEGVGVGDVEAIGAAGLGYFSSDTGQNSQEPFSTYVFPHDLQAGENELPVDVRLMRAFPGLIYEVSGRVYDGQTNALPGVGVSVEWGEDDGDSYSITDSNGMYRLYVPGFEEGEIYADPVPVRYLGLLASGRGLAVTSNMTGVDIYCPRATILARGKVVAADNQDPVPGATIYIEGDSFGASGVSLADGKYAVGLVPHNPYRANAEGMEGLGFLAPTAQEGLAIMDGSWTNLDFNVDRGFFVSGTVYDAQTNTLSGGNVGAFRYPSQRLFWQMDYNTSVNRSGAYTLLAPTGQLVLVSFDFDGFIGKVYANYDYADWDESQSADPVLNLPPGTSGIDFFLPRAAVIEGQVRGAGTGLPNSFVFVEERLGEDDYQWRGGADTDENGFYSIEVAPGSNYVVSANPPENEGLFWLFEYFSNKVDREDADLVATTVEAPATNINFDLETGGIISGWVYDQHGSPVYDCPVQAEINGYGMRDGWTDETGRYEITLPPGTYLVQARPDWENHPYLRQYWSNAMSEAEADDVVVTANTRTSNITFRLRQGGTISGHIYQGDGVTPLAGCHVYTEDYEFGEWMDGDDTDENGAYTLRVPAGDYRVRAFPQHNDLRFANQYYDGTFRYDEAARVTVIEGADTGSIDFDLTPAGSIAGIIRDEHGTPVPYCHVSVDDYNTGDWVAGSESGSDGRYIIIAPSGSYRVIARPSDTGLPFMDQYYSNAVNQGAATEVVITGTEDVTGIDFQLRQGSAIHGRVTTAGGTIPVPECWVYASSMTGSGQGRTDENGNYVIRLPAGNYGVSARPDWDDLPFYPKYYSNVVTWSAATPVQVDADQEIFGINFDLEAGGTLSGHVYREDGITPVTNCHVYASTYDDNEWMAGGFTDGGGGYSLRMAPGEYRVRAYPQETGLPYASVYFSNTVDYSQATRVEVADGADTGGIDFNLTALAFITGHVRGPDGITPVVWCQVMAENLTNAMSQIWGSSGQDGTYTLQVPPGDYLVFAAPLYSMLNYYNVFYSNKWLQTEANPVTATAAGVTGNIDFRLMDWDYNWDNDADHMGDTWETEKFGSIYTSDGTDDYDGDGLIDVREHDQGSDPIVLHDTDNDGSSDLDEWIAGTNPNQSNSIFKIRASLSSRNDFAWQTVTGRLYSLYGTTNLSGGGWITNMNRSPGDGTIWIITNRGGAREFYHLGVERAP